MKLTIRAMGKKTSNVKMEAETDEEQVDLKNILVSAMETGDGTFDGLIAACKSHGYLAAEQPKYGAKSTTYLLRKMAEPVAG